MTEVPKTLRQVGDGAYAYVQHDGSWGWSNSGLVVEGDQALVVDTLFDLRLTRELLDAYRRVLPAGAAITTLVNTHANATIPSATSSSTGPGSSPRARRPQRCPRCRPPCWRPRCGRRRRWAIWASS